MKKGIKKAATVVAAIALLSACGSNKIQTHEVSNSETTEILNRAFGGNNSADEITTFAGVACHAMKERGKEGAEEIRSMIYDLTQDPNDAVDAVSGIVLNYCPDLAK